MPRNQTAKIKPQEDFEAPGLAPQLGEPDHARRLSDKVLAAFNHAYSVGEVEIANQLRAVLERLDNAGPCSPVHQRAVSGAEQADRWMAFVGARNAYTALLDDAGGRKPDELQEALGRMKEAYLRWSQG
ncbi:MAG: hypothetical protein QNJ94_18955 [Alphaproteobacteria bacterium]|nr:hypothetical protein [Alphaproteobacteria bacterium]